MHRHTAIFIVLGAILSCAAGSQAQIEKSLQFIPENLDFGMIREADGKVTKSVKAVNISGEPTFIISARTSCGCSEAEYDGRMLAPGDTTTIRITYDPANRPGKFQKTAKIFTGRERISNMLRIRGNVIPSSDHLDKTYPEKVGDLRLSSLLANVGEMGRTETRPIFIGIYNDSGQSLSLKVESDADALETTLQPDTIEPYGISTLSMMLKGRKTGEKITDFNYKAIISDAATGETLLSIPVGGRIK